MRARTLLPRTLTLVVVVAACGGRRPAEPITIAGSSSGPALCVDLAAVRGSTFDDGNLPEAEETSGDVSATHVAIARGGATAARYVLTARRECAEGADDDVACAMALVEVDEAAGAVVRQLDLADGDEPVHRDLPLSLTAVGLGDPDRDGHQDVVVELVVNGEPQPAVGATDRSRLLLLDPATFHERVALDLAEFPEADTQPTCTATVEIADVSCDQRADLVVRTRCAPLYCEEATEEQRAEPFYRDVCEPIPDDVVAYLAAGDGSYERYVPPPGAR